MRKFFVTIIIIVACVTPSFSQRRRQAQQCVTPDNYYGVCVALSYCPQVVNIFQTASNRASTNYVFALERSCGTRNINGDPVVCCTRPLQEQTQRPATQRPSNPFLPTQGQATRPQVVQPTTPNTERNTRNPQTRPPPPATTTQVLPVVPPPPTAAPLIDSRATNCRDPDALEGVCIPLQNCDELSRKLLAMQNDVTFADYLRASNRICGGAGSNVCCPSKASTGPPTSAPVKVRNSNEVPRRLPTLQEGCGYTKNSYKKIVGGEVSKKGAWPWVALIGYNDGISASPFKCGGTLVTARHVVTAAHCIRRDLTFVRLGEHDLTTDTEAQHFDIRVVKQEAHPSYNKRNGKNDIALLTLEQNVQFNDFIAPICLPTTPELIRKSYVRYTPFVVGWGKTMEGGVSANVLQELQIPIYDNEVCKDRYRAQNRLLTEDQFDAAVICAGVLSGGKDTCQGDSGGPLMIPEPYQNAVRYYLIGVVSYGIGCARPEVPGVYASVQHFMNWIVPKIAETS